MLNPDIRAEFVLPRDIMGYEVSSCGAVCRTYIQEWHQERVLGQTAYLGCMSPKLPAVSALLH